MYKSKILFILLISFSVYCNGQNIDEYGICRTQKVDLGLSVKWAGYNIGATVPEEYGGLYGWADISGNKTSEKLKDYPSKNPPKNISGDVKYDIARSRWGRGWQLPSLAEMKELEEQCQWEWIIYHGVKGYKITGPNGNAIFLPAAGYREGTLTKCRNKTAHYWIGLLNDTTLPGGRYICSSSCALGFYDKGFVITSDARCQGNSVRAVIVDM